MPSILPQFVTQDGFFIPQSIETFPLSLCQVNTPMSQETAFTSNINKIELPYSIQGEQEEP